MRPRVVIQFLDYSLLEITDICYACSYKARQIYSTHTSTAYWTSIGMAISIDACAGGECEIHYHTHDPVFGTVTTSSEAQALKDMSRGLSYRGFCIELHPLPPVYLVLRPALHPLPTGLLIPSSVIRI